MTTTQVFSATLLPATAIVHTARGEAYTINVEAACVAIAQLHSNAANEERFGWTLNEGWYVGELQGLYAAGIERVAPRDSSVAP